MELPQSNCGGILLVLLVLSLLSIAPQLSESALVITLNEVGGSPITIAVQPNQTRTLDLVTNHTYHISCRDDSPHGTFDIDTNKIWWHGNTLVTKYISPPFPRATEPVVYTSTLVNIPISNEWTLVLQKVGVANNGLGVFSCHGLDGQLVSINIQQTSHTIIAGDPKRFFVVGRSSGNSIVTLTTLVSPPLPRSSVTWLFNGHSQAFPEDVSVVGNEVLLSGPISLDMQGNYTSVADFGEVGVASTSIIVTVYALPRVTLTPDVSHTSVHAFNDSRFAILCSERAAIPSSQSIAWNKDGVLFVADDRRVQITSTSSIDEVTSILIIDPLLPRDNGNYRCTAQNMAGSSEASFTLTNPIVASTIDYPKVYLEGATVTLQIHISAPPSSSMMPEIHKIWKKDGQLLPEASRYSTEHSILPDGASIVSLEIMDAQTEDSGVYSCELSNNISSKTVAFDFVGVVSVNISSSLYISPYDVLMIGHDASLLCKATFNNVPSSYMGLNVSISWKRTSMASVGTHVWISTEMLRLGEFERTYGSNLTFSPTMRGDGGRYVCSVRYRIASGGEVVVHHYDTSLNLDSMLFQLKLLGIGTKCQEWINSNVDAKLNTVVNATLLHVNQLCPSCTLTSSHMTSSSFQCFSSSPESVFFVTRLHATHTSTSATLLSYVLSWAEHSGAISAGDIQARLDGSCSFETPSLEAVGCNDGTVSATPTITGGVAGVPVVIVASVSAVVGCVVAALLLSLILCSFCRHSVYTSKSKNITDSSGPIQATNPTLPLPHVTEGLEPEYEDLDKYADPDQFQSTPGTYEKKDSMRVAHNHMYEQSHLTYDYAAV